MLHFCALIWRKNPRQSLSAHLISASFEEAYAPALYEELRITDWRDILTERQIEALLCNPTAEGLERILAITEPMYFDRIYGVFMGLKNAGVGISGNVEKLLTKRKKRFLSETLLRNLKSVSLRDDQIFEIMSKFKTIEEFLNADQASAASLSIKPGLVQLIMEDIGEMSDMSDMIAL